MILSLENIGKLKKANIEIKGITVIGGENDTGKSTVGKVLYSIFNSFYNIDEQICQQKIYAIKNTLSYLVYNFDDDTNIKIAKYILDNKKNCLNDRDILKKYIIKSVHDIRGLDISLHDSENIVMDKINDILNIDENSFFEMAISNRFKGEFAFQINSIYSTEDGYIKLKIKDFNMKLSVQNNEVHLNSIKRQLNTEAIYIDDPFILDELPELYFKRKAKVFRDHRLDLKEKLYYDTDKSDMVREILSNQKLRALYEKINKVCSGVMVNVGTAVSYRKPNETQSINVCNLSTGLKTFVILKTLLQKGWIGDNGTIILDEPEIHLHPEWQLLFAELIVMLQKEFNLHVLMTTHSPYFLNAIEVYSEKYGIADKCKYYMANNESDFAVIEDVTDDTNKIYAKLAEPFHHLEKERYADD